MGEKTAIEEKWQDSVQQASRGHNEKEVKQKGKKLGGFTPEAKN